MFRYSVIPLLRLRIINNFFSTNLNLKNEAFKLDKKGILSITCIDKKQQKPARAHTHTHTHSENEQVQSCDMALAVFDRNRTGVSGQARIVRAHVCRPNILTG